jgi:hypothetical protein
MRAKFAAWLSHSNPSMRGNAANTIAALDTYIGADALDARKFVGFGESVMVRMPSGTVKTKLDVVVSKDNELSGRVVFWDGATISTNEARVIAYPYAKALERMYPDEKISDICVWQVRRNNLHLVPLAEALSREADADAVLARL